MRNNRIGLTLIELMIVLALIAVLISLVLPAVNNIRQAAARIQTANNLKQVMLAILTYRDTNGTFPPASSTSPNNANHFHTYGMHLLPFLETDHGAFNLGNLAQNNIWPVVLPFTAPLDFTTTDFQRVQNYACNLRVFTDLGINTLYDVDMLTLEMSSAMTGSANAAIFIDGMSNTIALATRYANSGSIGYEGNVNCSAYDGAITSTPGPFFGVQVMTGVVNALGTTNGWQLAPTLEEVNCNWTIGLAHSFGYRGLQVALCDGCVRNVDASISAHTWNCALQPNDNHPPGTDW